MLKFYNSLSNKKENFIPINANEVKMYVCGPTLYDDIHLGNARPIVVFDVLYRLLKFLYPNVLYVRNITDVDDKIINRALLQKITPNELVKSTMINFKEDVTKLNCLEPTFEPRATQFIQQMQAMIATLIDNNYAYEIDGHVFFNVKKYENYGQLSKLGLNQMIEGVRIEVLDIKKNSADFVLWKPSLESIGWESPWGYGRPGWHIECSAMSKHYLGDSFDIHGGGRDLIFPHHENEIAQSVCCNAVKQNSNAVNQNGGSGTHNFVNYWLHNGFVTVDGTKMSKSLGNFITARQAIDKYNPVVVRFMLLSSHYRQNMDFNETLANQSFNVLDKFYHILLEKIDLSIGDEANYNNMHPSQDFLALLQDDLNIAGALSIIHRDFNLLKNLDMNNMQDKQDAIKIKTDILGNAKLLGLNFNNPTEWLKLLDAHNKSMNVINTNTMSEPEILSLIKLRHEAKQNKNFKKADEIRDQLKEQGVILTDTTAGTIWHYG